MMDFPRPLRRGEDVLHAGMAGSAGRRDARFASFASSSPVSSAATGDETGLAMRPVGRIRGLRKMHAVS